MKIAFITDGGLDMGMGHIYRTTMLAKEFEERIDKIFLTKSEDSVVEKIVKTGFEPLRCRDDHEILERLLIIRPEVVIIDRLDIDEEFARDLKSQLNIRLVVFENLVFGSNKHADVVVNAILGNSFGGKVENKNFYDSETKTLYFYGPKYLLLKDDFINYALNKNNSDDHSVDSILLIFGGSDPSNLTSTVLKELLKIKTKVSIDIILGHHFIYFDFIQNIVRNETPEYIDIFIHQDTNNVAQLMKSADLVITAPGISVFEALCVRTPVIVIHQNQWQRDGFSGYIDTLDKSEIYRIRDLIGSKEFLNPLDDHVKKLEIGQGKKEIINEILKVSSL